MFRSLDRVDWQLLHQQKLVLLGVLDGLDRNSSVAEALSGLVHLLDALQDDAAAAGRWTSPDEPIAPAATEPSPPERYYVEDDEGHHHGPMADYEEAATVADDIHARIIVQEVIRSSTSPEEDDQGGRA